MRRANGAAIAFAALTIPQAVSSVSEVLLSRLDGGARAPSAGVDLGLRLGDEAVLIADAAVHPALLDEPEWIYVSDSDPATSAETRRSLVSDLVDRDVLVACGHYPDVGIGRVVSRDGCVIWEASEPV